MVSYEGLWEHMEDAAQQLEVSSKLLSESYSEEMEKEENLNRAH